MTLDSLHLVPSDRRRVVLKIDVEGFEANVLRGAERLLMSGAVLAVITELNGSGVSYGDSDADVQAILLAAGFVEVTYEPFSRELTAAADPSSETRIFVQDIVECARRVVAAPTRRLGTGDIL